VLDDGTGPVWVGTGGGLHVLQGTELVPAQGPVPALPGPVYFLFQGPHGSSLWAGTDDGVFVSAPSGFRQLTSRHGLAGRETNRGASLVDHDGDVWVGTDQGLSVYRERYDLGPAGSPPVEIRSLEAGGEQLAPGAPVELHQRSLIVHAAPVALTSEEEVLCRYKLEGFDDDWQGPGAAHRRRRAVHEPAARALPLPDRGGLACRRPLGPRGRDAGDPADAARSSSGARSGSGCSQRSAWGSRVRTAGAWSASPAAPPSSSG
jgi:hypothetical protein